MRLLERLLNPVVPIWRFPTAVSVGALVTIASIIVTALGQSPVSVLHTSLFVGAVVGEALLVLALLGMPRPVAMWLRAAIAAIVCGVALWFSAQDTLGAPEYVFVHQRWLVALIVGCVLLSAWGALYKLRG